MTSFTARQIILVTGASSGIGEAIALRLNALGATVIANGRNMERLEANKAKATLPQNFHIEMRNLTEDIDDLPLWVKCLREKYGKLSGLVPCAGYGHLAPLREYTRQEANNVLDMHFHIPMLLARGFSDRRNNVGKGAAIVFMASGGVIAKAPGQSMYGSAKGALMAATGILSKELVSQGIRVNALAPAMVSTPMGDAFFSFVEEDAKKKHLAAYPMGIGTPDDVAGMAVFLLSEQGRWITGQILVLDGGRY